MDQMGSNQSHGGGSGDGDVSLPEGIVFEILLRLPVSCLCRFRLVSSLWRSIIDDPHFVSAHYALSIARPKLLIAVNDTETARTGGRTTTTKTFFFSADYPTVVSNDQNQLIADYHCRIPCSGYFRFGSTRGLICNGSAEGVFVCNPSTGESVSVPPPSAHHQRYQCFMCYDPIDNKYKIVASSPFYVKEEAREIHVLTLGENKWRRIDPGIPELSLTVSQCVDGVLHLVGVTKQGKGYYLSFHVSSESFRAIPLPESLPGDCLDLIKFNGRVGLLEYWTALVEGMGGRIRVWMVEDHNRVWSYKEFSITTPLAIALDNLWLNFVGAIDTGELVFVPPLSAEPFQLCLYNMEDATMRIVDIPGLHDRVKQMRDSTDDRVFIHSHLESIQSLRGFGLGRRV